MRTVEYQGSIAVRKLFASPEDWRWERDILSRLSGRMSVPRLLCALPGVLLLEYLPYPTLLDELERQEREEFCPTPWLALRRWLEQAQALCGYLPEDVNLRNFLWDAQDSRMFGLDFESYCSAKLTDVLANAAAFILEYAPPDTEVKRRAARILCNENPQAARESLKARRGNRKVMHPDASFILLAGGKSSRMGRDKAELPFLGTSLLELQLDKARMLGVDDILVSGFGISAEGARIIPDVYPQRGPLGGLHACLSAAKHAQCMVLGVDMPLIPASLPRELLQVHAESEAEITLSIHGDRWQPLVGIYDAHLSERIVPLIAEDGASVRALLERSACQFHPSDLPDAFWVNCNTPEAYHNLFNG